VEHRNFKIIKAFLIPFFGIILLLFILLIISMLKGQFLEKAILLFSFIATLLIGIEAGKREITLTKDGLKLKKFFRVKTIAWSDITHLAIVELRKKVYFLVTTTKGFYFFSNMFENHALLIRSVADQLETEKVETEIRSYLDHPVERHSLVIICWLAVAIMIAFIFLKVLPV